METHHGELLENDAFWASWNPTLQLWNIFKPLALEKFSGRKLFPFKNCEATRQASATAINKVKGQTPDVNAGNAHRIKVNQLCSKI